MKKAIIGKQSNDLRIKRLMSMEYHCCIWFGLRGMDYQRICAFFDLLPSINDTNYCLGGSGFALFILPSSTGEDRF